MESREHDLRTRVRAGERLVADWSQRLLVAAPDAVDPAITDAIAAVGEWLDADGALFVRFGPGTAEPTHVWHRPASPLPVAPEEIADHLPRWVTDIEGLAEPFFVAGLDAMSDDDLADGRDLIRALGTHAVAGFPVTPNGVLDGLLAYGWWASAAPPADVVSSVALMSDVVQHAIVRASSERSALAQARRFEALVRNATEGLLVVDVDGRVEWASSNVERLIGVRPGMNGSVTSALIHEGDRDAVIEAFAEVSTHPGRTGVTTFRAVHPDGGDRWIEMTLSNFVKDPAIGGIVINTRDVSERVAAAAALEWTASHDRLTGLLNTNALLGRIQNALGEHGPTPALLTIDIDRFRVLNDSLGHEAGNRVLVKTAERLQRAVRADDHVARVGGDEFAVLFSHVPDDSHLQSLIDRVLEQVNTPVRIDGLLVQISTSGGVATVDADTDDPTTLLRASDSAMARAKRAGRGHVVRFHADLRRESERRLEVEQSIHRALANEEFVLHYQPIVDLVTGRTVGAEALVRWLDPHRGLVPPGEFIPIAEETGLVVDIGRWVLDAAARDAAQWHAAFGTTISINVAVHQLVDARFPDLVAETISRHGISPQALCFELTETGDTDAWGAVAQTLHGLREIGSRIAMDDLGTGYATLERLRHLPVDIVKLDAGHVGRIERSPVDAAIVRALTELAKALEVVLVAEGVETERTHAQLQSLGATLGQGFLYGRPAPASDYEARLGSIADTA